MEGLYVGGGSEKCGEKLDRDSLLCEWALLAFSE